MIVVIWTDMTSLMKNVNDRHHFTMRVDHVQNDNDRSPTLNPGHNPHDFRSARRVFKVACGGSPLTRR